MDQELTPIMTPFIDGIIAARQAIKSYFQKRINLIHSNISYEMFQVLNMLWKKNEVNQQEIANAVQKGKASLTPLIDNLVKLGLVTRTEDTVDRRNKIIALTADGKDLKKKFDPIIGEFSRHFNAGIPVTLIKEMTTALSKMTLAVTE